MPLTDSYGQGNRFAILTDRPNARTLAENIVEDITPKTVMRFPSASVRGAILTSPESGMYTWLEDVKRLEIYDGARWVEVTVNPRTGNTYTPVISGGFSLGNGWTYGNYVRLGAWVQVTAMVYCGSTSRITSSANVQLSIPIEPAQGPGGNTINFAGHSVVNPGAGYYWAGGCWTYSGRSVTQGATMHVVSGGAYKPYGETSLSFQAGGWISMNITYLGV